MPSPPSSSERSARAPATTTSEWWVNISTNLSSLGISAWNQRIIRHTPTSTTTRRASPPLRSTSLVRSGYTYPRRPLSGLAALAAGARHGRHRAPAEECRTAGSGGAAMPVIPCRPAPDAPDLPIVSPVPAALRHDDAAGRTLSRAAFLRGALAAAIGAAAGPRLLAGVAEAAENAATVSPAL